MSDGDPSQNDATGLLQRVVEGDRTAEDELYSLVYAELHRIARAQMDRQSEAHTLQPTALVHEAWMRLLPREVAWNDREHFLSFASRVMRTVLVDHARKRLAERRGGGRERVSLDVALDRHEKRGVGVLELDGAMEELFAEDAALARIVELRFFGGLSMEECARAEGVSLSTAERRWRLARMWLRTELERPTK